MLSQAEQLQALMERVAGASPNGHVPTDFTPPGDTLFEWFNQGRTWIEIVRGYAVYAPDLQKLLTSIGAGNPNGSPTGKRYTVHIADDALLPRPPIDYLIDGLIQTESGVCGYGMGGSKKTYISIDAGVCVAAGIPWLGRTVKQGTVLFIDEESGRNRFMHRLEQVMRGHSLGAGLPFYFTNVEAFNFKDPDRVDEIEEIIRDYRPVLVIMDALIEMAAGLDENASKEMGPIFQKLKKQQKDYGLVHWLIHHANRLGTYRGASCIRDGVNMMFEIASKQNEEYVCFTSEKVNDIEPFKFAANAVIDPVNDTFILSPSSVQMNQKLSDPEQWVFDYLSAHGPTKLADLITQAATASHSRRAIERAIHDLENVLIRKVIRGIYELLP